MAQRESSARVWWICTLLLCASTINYMDRQTLSNAADRIKSEFQIQDAQYGSLEWGFGWAFAAGAMFFGILADRTNIRWLYPAVLVAWSAMGFATGLVESYYGLFACRFLLGLFEAGHWPCALKTTQKLLPASRRALGNSVLQSGTAIGAIITPLILTAMLTDKVGSWRPAFQTLGAIGGIWAIFWCLTIRQDELLPTDTTGDGSAVTEPFFETLRDRRFLTLVGVVILINISYHFFRVWLKLYLVNGPQYDERFALQFVTWFYVANDVGCLGAGLLTAGLSRRGCSPVWARGVTFAGCAALVALGGLLPFLSAGPALLGVMLVVSMGLLGLFPCYYAFTQDLSASHQGKVSGSLGTVAWLTVSPLHWAFGKWMDQLQVKRYDVGLAVVALLPLLATLLLAIGWRSKSEAALTEADDSQADASSPFPWEDETRQHG